MPLDSWQRIQNLATFARRKRRRTLRSQQKKNKLKRIALTAGAGLGTVGAAYGLSKLLPTKKQNTGTGYRTSSNSKIDPAGDLKYREMDRFRTEQGYAKGKKRRIELSPDQYAQITRRMGRL